MKMWVSNYSLEDITGGTEVLGEQFSKALGLKYMSARKFGIQLPRDADTWHISAMIDERLTSTNAKVELLVHNSTNCWTDGVPGMPKIGADRKIVVMCENFLEEANAIRTVMPALSMRKRLMDWPFQQYALRDKKIVCISDGERETLKEQYGVDSINLDINVIEPYVDTDVFKPGNRKPYDKLTGLFVGRQHDRKGWDIIRKLSERGHNIRSLTGGNLSREALVEEYTNADYLIMPSRYESFGFIYAEALACNLPVISSRVGLFKMWQPAEYGIFPKDITVDAFDVSIREFVDKTFEKSRSLATKRFGERRFRRECSELLSDWE